jgi:N5-(cytidine 5'-diphosphoramidyl)-L-glutamine hydrolase
LSIRIGITQRTHILHDRSEVRDSLDIKLIKLLLSLNIQPILLSNFSESHDVYLEYLNNYNLDGFILSGGGESIHERLERNILETCVLDYSLKRNLPILGICRGMQVLNCYNGGTVKRITNHVNIKHKITFCSNLEADRIVNSFHDYGIGDDELSEEYNIIAKSSDGLIEMIQHKNRFWVGIMWHPERMLNEFEGEDLNMIKKLFNNGKV